MKLYKLFNYILHLPNKIIYPLNNLDKKIFKNFQHKGYLYKNFNDEKKDLFNEINLYIEQNLNLEKIREKSLSDNNKNYTTDIIDLLDNDLKFKIEKYLSAPDIIKKVSSCLGYSVKFRGVMLFYNFHNPNTIKDEGPKLYHRDSDSLHDQVKLFILLNDINQNNGMFYFVPKFLIKDDLRFKLLDKQKNMSIFNKWRIFDDQLNLYLKNTKIMQKIKRFKGNAKEGLFIDTSVVYHKGGHIRDPDKYRILLQGIYTPKLSLSHWNDNNSKIITYFQTKLTSFKNKLRKQI
tara:strand:+ start:608 stop:1480 length:873 start_codon:yes stop_codon:yes gene_type:complete